MPLLAGPAGMMRVHSLQSAQVCADAGPAHCTKNVSLWLVLGFTGLGCAWLFPGHFFPWPGFRQEVLAAVAFIVLSVAAFTGVESINWPRIAVIAFAAAGIPLLQLAFGQIDFRGGGLLCATYLVAFATSIAVGATLASGKSRAQLIDGFAACTVSAGIASSGMALCQWLGPSGWEGLLDLHDGRRPIANIGQPNHLSTLLLLGVAGALHWYESRRINGWSAAFVVAWLGCGIVLTESRTGWLNVAVISLWWFFMRKKASLRLRTLPIALGVAAFALAVCSLSELHVLVGAVEPVDASGTTIRLDAGSRPLHWAMLADALRQSPWWGYGWSQVANAQFAVSANHPATGAWLTQSHNLVLDLLVYNGLPVGLLLSSLLLLWLVQHARACNDATSWCLLLALFMLFTHALLENPLHYAYFLLPAGLLIGILSEDLRAERQSRGGRLSLAMCIAVLLVPLTVVTAEYFRAEQALRELGLAFARIGKPPSELPQPDWYLLDGWAAYHRASTMAVSAGMQPEQIDELRKVASRYPYPYVLMQYARASALNANPEAAHRAFVHGCKVLRRPTCEAMRKVWSDLQSSEPKFRPFAFPAWSG